MEHLEPAGKRKRGAGCRVSSLRALTFFAGFDLFSAELKALTGRLGLGIESELSLLSLCATVTVKGSGLRVVGW